ncbi:MAG: hypothetical protein AAF242_06250 [Bacteroidota bacterium]
MKKTILPILLLLSFTSFAQTINWDGGGDGTSWTDPMNWDLDRVPNPTDFILIQASVSDLTIELDGSGEGAALELDGASQNITFTITAAGVLTLIDSESLFDENGLLCDSRMGANISFTNNGEVFIQKNGNGGTENGIFIDAGGPGGIGSSFTFINNNIIRIRDTWESGMEISMTSNSGPSSFDNNGLLEITNAALSEGDEIIETRSTVGLLTFTNDGTIIGDGSGDVGIDFNDNTEVTNNGLLLLTGDIPDSFFETGGPGSSFTNNGLFQIDAIPGEPGLAAISNSRSERFTNTLCGVINVTSQAEISLTSGLVSNAGIITSAYTGNANEGTITNTGEIRTPDGSGNGLIIDGGSATTGPIPAEEPISGTCPPLPSLPGDEEVADLPAMHSIWSKLGLLVLVLSFSILFVYNRKL